MYPTVNSLMGLWQFVTARKIRFIEHCHEEIIQFLNQLKFEKLFLPATWKKFAAFVKVVPNGDILPTRSKYSSESNDWQVGINHLYTGGEKCGGGGIWYSLPDVIASVILTGKIPKIVDAFRMEPWGVLRGLKPVRLRGQILINPAKHDFFQFVIEQRKALWKDPDLSREEKERLDRFLKVLANSASYGIYAEMNAEESDEQIRMVCHGIDEDPYQCTVAHPEEAGEYCFPPLASLITGGARLMLAHVGAQRIRLRRNLRHGGYRFHGHRCDTRRRCDSLPGR